MARFLIALGTSHPDGLSYLESSMEKIRRSHALTFICASRIYKNSSFGTTYNSIFHNCVCAIRSDLNPLTLYRELMSVEMAMGRIRTYKFARRTIDIDVLMSLEFTFTTGNFVLPHREAFRRNFFVVPATQALKLANWPIPITLLNAQAKMRQGYLILRGLC
ncbi:MAG TPA: 2-amino-4-hydroxy-6-hydroxymethyldihydropteridine diphosphokinase [Myxococcota bacterium]|nr:2-amino-4-hydroxy-6-hydroxymethyldihydropteridine diphosphokinase [Myxococcota bacterium]